MPKHQQQRNMLLFENSIRSVHTKKTSLYHLKNFLEFYHIKDYDSLAGIDVEKMQIMVEDYVMHLKKIKSPNSLGFRIYDQHRAFAGISNRLLCTNTNLK